MNVHIFLAHAVKVELETEQVYLNLAEFMATRENHDVAEFFREMAGFCRLHRDTAMRRAGFDYLSDAHSAIALWPGDNFEAPHLKDSETPLDLDGAMSLSLAAEKRGVAFYEEIARMTTDAQTRLHAEEFAVEERGHVLALERFFGLKSY